MPTPAETIAVRPARETDAVGLYALNEIFNGEGSNTLEVIESSLKRNVDEIVSVACDGDHVVGFCCGQIFRSMCYAVNYGELTELFVLDAYRRRGVGGRLIAHVESELGRRGAVAFRLLTGRDNRAAQALYRAHGYAELPEVLFRKGEPEGEDPL